MNCKPGDLAVIVRSHDQRNIGKLVTVLQPYDEVSWYITSPSVLHHCIRGALQPGFVTAIYDAELRPIRDPGEDAVDETLQRLPAPRDEVTE